MYLLPSAVAESRIPGEGPNIFRSDERVLPTRIDALKDLDNLTRVVNAVRYGNPMRSYPPPGDYLRGNFGKLRETLYPVTLGDNVKFHLNLFKPLSHRLTISPPAFGLTKRPGDDFAPWQRTLAEEAPKLATTTYRHAVDDADFEQTIDETGQVRNSTGTRSARRTRPRSAPPRAMGYLKSTVRTLEEMNKNIPNDHSIYAPYDPAAYSSTSGQTKLQDTPPKLRTPIRNVDLLVSPVQAALTNSRLERLQLEEALLLQAEKVDRLEAQRGPAPFWYALKTPQFFYEARKHNRQLNS